MTVIIYGQNSDDVQTSGEERNLESETTLVLDGGFSVPETNAFGHGFRDYNKESERRSSVEEFYRINHVNQTYEFVWKCGIGYRLGCLCLFVCVMCRHKASANNMVNLTELL